MIIFLIINFILLILAFFFLVILYLRQSRLQDMEKKQSSMIKEMEDLLTTYLLEMKEENELFLEKIHVSNLTERHSLSQKSQNKEQLKKPNLKERINANQSLQSQVPHIDLQIGEENPSELLPDYRIDNEIEPDITLRSNTTEQSANENIKHTDEKQLEIQDQSLDTIIAKALELQKQGFTIDNIAKQLNKGKTEIELLLKFRQTSQF